ncbi:unnamed protein product [Diabrotica balteata]|uniref:Uncharacterized protein n=1 Tax=Diabrotica balteata TaxID=107213 RepID=A0A9N9SLH6_DIABA|nr:unnamed protein product [Diabrotica balteata]
MLKRRHASASPCRIPTCVSNACDCSPCISTLQTTLRIVALTNLISLSGMWNSSMASYNLFLRTLS